MSTSRAIETTALSKSYGDLEAVRDLNLRVPRGCITGFLGRNGAGKSTTIKMLLGMIRPSSGDGFVLGQRISDLKASVDTRRRLAYVSEDKRLYDYMTVDQIIQFTSSFYKDWRADIVGILLDKYGLPRRRKIKSLSKGMRTKLALLLAFARRAELLILDEPSEGLDPVGIEQLLETLVSHCSEGAAVFFSSHQIDEVERIADHVCILDRGHLLVDASLDDLRSSYRRINLSFQAAPLEREFQIPGVERIRTRGGHMSLLASWNTQEVVERAQHLHALSVEVAPVGLREIFLDTVRER